MVSNGMAAALDVECPPEMNIRTSGVDPEAMGIWCTQQITKGRQFGPFEGERVEEAMDDMDPSYVWEIVDLDTKEFLWYLNATDPDTGNWMRYINCARYFEEQNIVSQQEGVDIYYRAIKDISPGDELLTWYEKAPLRKKRNKKGKRKSKGKSSAEELLVDDATKSSDSNDPTSAKDADKPAVILPIKLQDDQTCVSQRGRRRKVTKYWEMENPDFDEDFSNDDDVGVQGGMRERASEDEEEEDLMESDEDWTTGQGQKSGIEKALSGVDHDGGKYFQFEMRANHVVKSRRGRKVFKCDICSGIYRHSFSLKRHYVRNHINYRYVSTPDLINCNVSIATANRVAGMQRELTETKPCLSSPDEEKVNGMDGKQDSDKENAGDDDVGPIDAVDNRKNRIVAASDEVVNKTEVVPCQCDGKSEDCPRKNKEAREDLKQMSEGDRKDSETRDKTGEEVKQGLDADTFDGEENQDNNNCDSKEECRENDKVEKEKEKEKNEFKNVVDMHDVQKIHAAANGDEVTEVKDIVKPKIDADSEERSKTLEKVENAENDDCKVECSNDSESLIVKVKSTELQQSNAQELDTVTEQSVLQDSSEKKCDNKISIEKQIKTMSEGKLSETKFDDGSLPTKSASSGKSTSSTSREGSSSPPHIRLPRNRGLTLMPGVSERDPVPLNACGNAMPGLYRCNICEDLFNSASSLKVHIADHPEPEGGGRTLHPCTQCHMKFSHRHNLVRHQAVHNADLGAQFHMCSTCSKSFSSASHLKRHLRTHQGGATGCGQTSVKLVECPHCDLSFLNRDDLKRHLRRLHPDQFHECAFCPCYYDDVEQLEQHLEAVHCEDLEANHHELSLTQAQSQVDEIADRAESRRIAAHNRKLHKPGFRFACTVCKKRFQDYANMCRHRRLSHGSHFAYIARCGKICNREEWKSDSEYSPVKSFSDYDVDPVGAYYAGVARQIADNLKNHMEGRQEDIWQCESLIKWKRAEVNAGLAPTEITVVGKGKSGSVGSSSNNKMNLSTYNFPSSFKLKNAVEFYRSVRIKPLEDIVVECDATVEVKKELVGSGECSALQSILENPAYSTRYLEETHGKKAVTATPKQQNPDGEHELKKDTPESKQVSLPIRVPTISTCKVCRALFHNHDTYCTHMEKKHSIVVSEGHNGKTKMEAVVPVLDVAPKNGVLHKLLDMQLGLQSNVTLDGAESEGGSPPTLSPQPHSQCEPIDLSQAVDLTDRADHILNGTGVGQDSVLGDLPILKHMKVESGAEQVKNGIDDVGDIEKDNVFNKISADEVGKNKGEDLMSDDNKENRGSVDVKKFICTACFGDFYSEAVLLEHQRSQHPLVECSKSVSISEYNFTWKMNPKPVGALNIPGSQLPSVATPKKLTCTRCTQQFPKMPDLHTHIVDCGADLARPRMIYVYYMPWVRGHRARVNKVQKTSPKKSHKRNHSVAMENITNAAVQSATTPTTPASAAGSVAGPGAEPQGEDMNDGVLDDDDLSRKRRRRNYELLYNPMNHVRRREFSEVIDVQKCSFCTEPFKTISLLERHIPVCPQRDRIRDDASGSGPEAGPEDVDEDEYDPNKHLCIYCLKQFTYFGMLRKHVFDVCPVRRDLVEEEEYIDEEWEADLNPNAVVAHQSQSTLSRQSSLSSLVGIGDGSNDGLDSEAKRARRRRRRGHGWANKSKSSSSSNQRHFGQFAQGNGEYYYDLVYSGEYESIVPAVTPALAEVTKELQAGRSGSAPPGDGTPIVLPSKKMEDVKLNSATKTLPAKPKNTPKKKEASKVGKKASGGGEDTVGAKTILTVPKFKKRTRADKRTQSDKAEGKGGKKTVKKAQTPALRTQGREKKAVKKAKAAILKSAKKKTLENPTQRKTNSRKAVVSKGIKVKSPAKPVAAKAKENSTKPKKVVGKETRSSSPAKTSAASDLKSPVNSNVKAKLVKKITQKQQVKNENNAVVKMLDDSQKAGSGMNLKGKTIKVGVVKATAKKATSVKDTTLNVQKPKKKGGGKIQTLMTSQPGAKVIKKMPSTKNVVSVLANVGKKSVQKISKDTLPITPQSQGSKVKISKNASPKIVSSPAAQKNSTIETPKVSHASANKRPYPKSVGAVGTEILNKEPLNKKVCKSRSVEVPLAPRTEESDSEDEMTLSQLRNVVKSEHVIVSSQRKLTEPCAIKMKKTITPKKPSVEVNDVVAASVKVVKPSVTADNVCEQNIITNSMDSLGKTVKRKRKTLEMPGVLHSDVLDFVLGMSSVKVRKKKSHVRSKSLPGSAVTQKKGGNNISVSLNPKKNQAQTAVPKAAADTITKPVKKVSLKKSHKQLISMD